MIFFLILADVDGHQLIQSFMLVKHFRCTISQRRSWLLQIHLWNLLLTKLREHLPMLILYLWSLVYCKACTIHLVVLQIIKVLDLPFWKGYLAQILWYKLGLILLTWRELCRIYFLCYSAVIVNYVWSHGNSWGKRWTYLSFFLSFRKGKVVLSLSSAILT